jgi:hypothetical protein
VLVEPLVLDGHDRVLHQRSDLLRLEQHAPFLAAEHGEDRAAVVRVDVPVALGRDLVLRVELRDLARERCHEAEHEGDRAQQQHQPDEGQESKLANPPPRLRRRSR